VSKTAIDAISDRLNDVSAHVRVEAALWLIHGPVKAPQILNILFDALDDGDEQLANRVAKTLRQSQLISDKFFKIAVDRLLDMGSAHRISAAISIGRIGVSSASIESALTILTLTGTAQERAAALKTLGRLSPHNHILTFEKFLQNEDEHVRFRAVEALANTGEVSERILTPLLDVCSQGPRPMMVDSIRTLTKLCNNSKSIKSAVLRQMTGGQLSLRSVLPVNERYLNAVSQRLMKELIFHADSSICELQHEAWHALWTLSTQQDSGKSSGMM
jgi:hypothetical protein